MVPLLRLACRNLQSGKKQYQNNQLPQHCNSIITVEFRHKKTGYISVPGLVENYLTIKTYILRLQKPFVGV